MVVHDAVAMAEAIRPGILDTVPFPLDVVCAAGPTRGMVVADRRSAATRERSGSDGGRPVSVAMDADLDAVREFLLERLSS